MNMIAVKDNLFLTAQANVTFNLENALFGKVVTTYDGRSSDVILFLLPHAKSDLPLGRLAGIICTSHDPRLIDLQKQSDMPIVVVDPDIVFSHGDIISVSERGRIHRHFRSSSSNNALLVTEVCNNLCIMCPQPPKPALAVDQSNTERRIMQTLALMDEDTLPDSLCITGGEPTMLKEGLIHIVERIADRMPNTLIHLLTNGRYLCNEHYTLALANAGRHQLLAGIPLFGHVSDIHDYVVQKQGAFDQTLAGLLNCYKYGINIELRVVLHKVTVKYLKALAEFIARNLFFVKHVALMGMENMGYAKLNRKEIFVDPWDYKDRLSDAIEIFQLYGIEVRIFNLPLCIVNSDTQSYCVKSISDFKNSWHPKCEHCLKLDMCCGLFNSTTQKFWLSKHIQAFTANE